MLTVFERFMVVFASALITYFLTYALYRRTSASFWSYVSCWFMELPMFILFMTGSSAGAKGFDIFIHTLGIPVMAAILALVDILLIEIALLGFLKPFGFLFPKKYTKALNMTGIVKGLQKHYLAPRPERVGLVFIVAVMGGLVDLIMLLVFGAFA